MPSATAASRAAARLDRRRRRRRQTSARCSPRAGAAPLRGQIPRVLRPDLLLLDDDALALSELDSVPGGIGLTAWLNQVYAPAFPDVIGGARGMLDGFASIFPAGPCVRT